MSKRTRACHTLSPLALAPLDTKDAILPVFPPAVVLRMMIEKLGRYEHALVEYIQSMVNQEWTYYDESYYAHLTTIRTFEWPPWFNHIPSCMFKYSSLTHIELSECVKISSGALSGTRLERFKMHSGTLSYNALANCIWLQHVELGDVFVNEGAMLGCVRLVSVVVKTCVMLFASVFDGCIQLHTLILPDGSTMHVDALMKSFITHLTIKSTSLDRRSCADSHVAVVNYTDTPTTLPPYAFSSSNVLSVPPSLLTITEGCFNCTHITDVTLEDLTRIEKGGFEYCQFLTTFKAPKCMHVGPSAFADCESLNTLVVADGCHLHELCLNNTRVTALGTVVLNAYALTESMVETIGCITDAEQFSCYRAECLKNVNIACDIPSSCFKSTRLTHVRLDSTTKTIMDNAFYGVSTLVTIEGDGVTTIGANCFFDCENLVSACFPNLMYVGDYAFEGCSIDITITTK